MDQLIKNINTKTKDLILPAVAMRGLVCFPRFVMHFDVAREMSVKAVEAALKNDRLVFLTAQKDVYVEEPQEKDLYNIGVVAEIRQTLKTPDNVMRVLVEGLYRAKIKETVNENGMFVCTVKKLPDYSREKPDQLEIPFRIVTSSSTTRSLNIMGKLLSWNVERNCGALVWKACDLYPRV